GGNCAHQPDDGRAGSAHRNTGGAGCGAGSRAVHASARGLKHLVRFRDGLRRWTKERKPHNPVISARAGMTQNLGISVSSGLKQAFTLPSPALLSNWLSTTPMLYLLLATPFIAALLVALAHRAPRRLIAWLAGAAPLAGLLLLIPFT